MKSWVLALAVLACGCKDEPARDTVAAPSASAIEITTSSVPVTRGKWWSVAAKSGVYTEERRVDADNAVRLVQPPAREAIVRALDDMATQNADADGLRAASRIARDAQDKLDDAHDRAPRTAIATAGFMVLGGLVATSSSEHGDAASSKRLLAAIREMPLPHLEKSDGRPERLVLEQEMRAVLDDKTMKAALAGAPAPRKSD